MRRRFFVTGLPRSRTAWFANLFSTGDVLCHHDALLECDRVTDLPSILGRRAIVGDSDSGLLLFYSDVAAMYPGAPWVVIRRDPDEAFRSLVEHFGTDVSNGGWPILTAALQTIPAGNSSILSVSYDELGDVSIIRKIWNHCIPTVPFDAERWVLLRDLKIERIPRPLDPSRERALAKAVFVKGTV
jgi:hypothetical protein